MADDAGFAVALTVRESLLNNALLVAYVANSFPRRLNVPGGLPGGPPDAGLNVFLAPPRISCNADNTLTLALEMWGQLSAAIDGIHEAAQIDGHLTLRIQPDFSVSGTNLVLSPPSGGVTVTVWNFTVIPPGHFSTDAMTYLSSPIFGGRLQAAIQQAITLGVVSLPSIDISFLGPVANAVAMTAAARVRAGAVIIGLSIRTPDLTLVGDTDLLDDFAGSNDLAAATNAAAVPILLQDVKTMATQQVSENGATLQQLTIAAGAGKFLVAGKASNSVGSATFSFSVVPALYASRPGAFFQYLKKPLYVKGRTWPALGFTIADVSVDVDLATWVEIVGYVFAVLNVGIPFILHDLANGIAAQLTTAIQGADPGTPVPRVQRLQPASPGGPVVRVGITDYEITTDGTFIGITVTPEAPPGALIGLTSIPANLGSQTLNYAVRMPLGIVADDPALRIRWTVIDLASGHVLLNADGGAAGREAFGFVPATVGPGLTLFGITVRVYRTLGPQITDFLNDGITLAIGGPLRPGAYVRWRYDVKNPQVGFNGTSYAYLGEEVVSRHSNIHRTDKPCAMEAKRSRYLYELDVLDALPFSVSDIALHRSQLCDYCFYGGPAGIRPSL